MSRLTKKKGYLYYPTKENYLIPDDGSNVARLLQIVGKYEDLEEELGISLPILFKALKNGIYFKTPHNYEVYVHGNALMIDMETKQIKWNYTGGKANLKDYGKTWELCKEDLKSE